MAEVLHHDNHGHDGHHEHDDTDLTVFGFWTYLMSDLILFGSLFIAFAVLSSHVPAGTPSAYDLFHDSLGFVLTETFALLISSVTFGFAVLASYKKNVNQVITWLFITFLFGASFIGMEVYELWSNSQCILIIVLYFGWYTRYPRNFWFSVDASINVSNQN